MYRRCIARCIAAALPRALPRALPLHCRCILPRRITLPLHSAATFCHGAVQSAAAFCHGAVPQRLYRRDASGITLQAQRPEAAAHVARRALSLCMLQVMRRTSFGKKLRMARLRGVSPLQSPDWAPRRALDMSSALDVGDFPSGQSVSWWSLTWFGRVWSLTAHFDGAWHLADRVSYMPPHDVWALLFRSRHTTRGHHHALWPAHTLWPAPRSLASHGDVAMEMCLLHILSACHILSARDSETTPRDRPS